MPIAYLTAGLVNLAFIVFLLIRAPRSQARRFTIGVITALALWQFGEFGVLVAQSPEIACLWIKFTYGALILLPLSFLLVAMSFPERRERFWQSRAARIAALAPTTVLAALLPSSLLIRDATQAPWGFTRVEGPYFAAFEIYLPLMLLVSMASMLWTARNAPTQIQRIQAWYVIGGAVGPVILGIIDLDVLQPLGNRSFHHLIMPLSGVMPTTACVYALMRYRLFDVPGALRSGSVQAALVLLLLLPCIGVYVSSEVVLRGSVNGERELLVAVLLILAGFVFPRIKVAAHETLDQAFFRQRWQYRQVLTSVVGEIATILEMRTLVATLTTRIHKALHVENVALWIRSPDTLRYEDVGHASGRHVEGDDARQLEEWIVGRPARPWMIEDVAERPRAVDRVLRDGGAAIAFALHGEDEPLGVLALGPRSNGRPYLDDEIELLSTLAKQVAVAAENARLYEALKESKQMLQRASRLSAVGTLAAGLAHEIRNPLVAVQTFLQILPERLTDPEVMGELREVALDEMQRVCRLINDLLGMARSPVATFESTDLGDVVAQVVRLLTVSAEKKGVRLTLAAGALPVSYVDPARLKQAVLNLVMNAIQASPGGGEVAIATQSGVDPAGRAFIEIAVHDDGAGIPAAHLEAIFHPFFTTKDSGTGLGLAVTQQIVADHGGAIHVESAEGHGATFIVRLPVEEQPPAALEQMPPIYGLGKSLGSAEAPATATAEAPATATADAPTVRTDTAA